MQCSYSKRWVGLKTRLGNCHTELSFNVLGSDIIMMSLYIESWYIVSLIPMFHLAQNGSDANNSLSGLPFNRMCFMNSYSHSFIKARLID